MNRVPFLLAKEMFDTFTYAEGSAQAQRDNAIKDQYSKYTIPTENLYPNVMFSTEQVDRLAELSTDIGDYVLTTYSTTIVMDAPSSCLEASSFTTSTIFFRSSIER